MSGKFKELEDTDELEDLNEFLAQLPDVDEFEGFTKVYNRARSLFCDDSTLLDKFGALKTHLERVEFMSELQVVKDALNNLKCIRPTPGDLNSTQLPNQSKSTNVPPPLLGGPNKKYPHLSKAIEVKSSKSEGRYLAAVQRISPGDVLIVDKPYITSLFPAHYSSHCLACFKRLSEDFLECPSCLKVKFCDTSCYTSCFEKTHKWECGVLELIDNDEIGRMAAIAYRIVSQTGFEYLSSISDKLGRSEGTYTEGDYLAVYNQVDNMELRPTGDHLKRSFTALYLAKCLELVGWFHCKPSKDSFLYIAALLVRHIQSCACNAYEINEFVKKGESMINSESLELGGAVYPTISLSNHSCVGNTSRTNYGIYCVVRATRSIQPSEKVYDNYGQFYHIESKEERQTRLKLQYFFDCACAACKQNWPLYRVFSGQTSVYKCPGCGGSLGTQVDKIKRCGKCKKELKGLVKLIIHLDKLKSDFRKIMDGITPENANDYIKTYSILLTQIEKIFSPPCRELTECTQVLLQSYAVLGNHSQISPTLEESQVALFQGAGSDEDDDDDEVPGLI